MFWLILAILSYLISAVVFLVDKYLLSKPIPDPKIYCFYVGFLGGIAFLLSFFVYFYVPDWQSLVLAFFTGIVFLAGLFWLYKSLYNFEASRVVPAIGGLIPLFVWGLMYLFSQGTATLNGREFLAFFLLIAGSVLLTYEKTKISLKNLFFSFLAAFFFGFYFVLLKYVYLRQPFWNGFIWTRVGAAFFSLFFLVFPKVRQEVRRLLQWKNKEKKEKINKKIKTLIIFIANQAFGSGSAILQNFAVFLAPTAYVSLVAALQGTQYLFLFVLALIFSFYFPRFIKEEISKKNIIQKGAAISLIILGLIILVI